MSFKLAGDQTSGIKLIQKRRIAELLSSHISPDEALLTRSGKYACLVCRHKPTFDTLTTLSIHRNGQKHIRAAHEAMKKKQADREEIERRLQLAQVQGMDGSSKDQLATPPLLEQTQVATKNALMASVPYSSLALRCRKKEVGGEGRKDEGGGGGGGEPFFSRKRRAQEWSQSVSRAKHRRIASGGTSINQQKDSGSGTRPPLSVDNEERPVHGDGAAVESTDHGCHTMSLEAMNQSKPRIGLTKEQQKEYTKYRSSGWVRNLNGSWEKDPNVEFDSDEEPPHL